MKILITTDWYTPVINGVVTSVVNLTKGLTKADHEVRILTLSGSIHSYHEGNVTYIGSVSVGLVYPNARLKMAMTHHYIRDLVDWCPDVVHSQCEFSTFFLAKRIAKECGSPLVHTYHTVYEDFTHYFSPNARLGKFMAANLSRKILSKTQAVIVPTDKISDMLKRYGVKKPIYTVPTGLDLDNLFKLDNEKRLDIRKSFGISEKEPLFIYIGRLAKEKNISELFQLILNRNERLMLVGDGPYREKLVEEANSLGISNRIIFAGMVPPCEVPGFYKAGDIFICASTSETQGLTYIEAMASSLPIICKKDACLDSVIEPGYNGFEYSTQSEFNDTADKLLTDRNYHRLISLAARDTIQQNYSADSFASKAADVYYEQVKSFRG